MSTRIFVYGTLKSGLSNHGIIERCKRLHDTAFTADSWCLIDVGFPVMLPSTGGMDTAVVQGEVYEVDPDTLKRLDQLESVGRMYDRVSITVKIAGKPIKAMAYVGIPAAWTEMDERRLWPQVDSAGKRTFNWMPRYLRGQAAE